MEEVGNTGNRLRWDSGSRFENAEATGSQQARAAGTPQKDHHQTTLHLFIFILVLSIHTLGCLYSLHWFSYSPPSQCHLSCHHSFQHVCLMEREKVNANKLRDKHTFSASRHHANTIESKTAQTS